MIQAALPMVYHVRHGDTAWTLTAQHTGRTDLPLNEQGERQARELGASLTALRIDRIRSSPLQRARRTVELALSPGFRADFRESLYRMVGSLTGIGVTVLNTVELSGAFEDIRFSPHEISFLTDDIILQRYVELDGQLQKIVTVVKTRRGNHSKDFRFYRITEEGMVVGETLHDYRGILSGFPTRI